MVYLETLLMNFLVFPKVQYKIHHSWSYKLEELKQKGSFEIGKSLGGLIHEFFLAACQHECLGVLLTGKPIDWLREELPLQ